MVVISVVGTSGVGKSFLVKQLATATTSPAFFEGEEGTIPHEILDNIFKTENPLGRWQFFIDRYKKNLESARLISNSGIDCYVDGSTLSSKAILQFEDKKYWNDLLAIIQECEHLTSDFTILIIANEKKLRTHRDLRLRKSESHDKAINRALKIQEAFIELAKKEKDIVIIDRSELDFTNPDHVEKILDKLKVLRKIA